MIKADKTIHSGIKFGANPEPLREILGCRDEKPPMLGKRKYAQFGQSLGGSARDAIPGQNFPIQTKPKVS